MSDGKKLNFTYKVESCRNTLEKGETICVVAGCLVCWLGVCCGSFHFPLRVNVVAVLFRRTD